MNRLQRLTSILTRLQSKRKITSKELADTYKVSQRTIYRDMRTLEEAGIPLVGEAGTGYSLVEGYRLPPVMFTQEEAFALLLAEKLFDKISDRENANHFEAAMVKIKAVLKSTQKDALEEISHYVSINRRNPLTKTGQEQVISRILNGIREHTRIRLKYTSFDKDETTTREVEPIGIYYAFEQWYLIAYCTLRQDYRTFRLSRILELFPTTHVFDPSHPTLEAYLEKVRKEEALVKIVISIPKSCAKYLSDQKYNHGWVKEEEKGEGVHVTFMCGSEEGFVRWIIMLGDWVKIVEPESLQNSLLELLQRMVKWQLYGDN